LLDLGVLTLRQGKLAPNPQTGLPRVPPSHPAIVEWRAMTVIELSVSIPFFPEFHANWCCSRFQVIALLP
jgi:hypothetical protein